jgi:hypothetical protein
VTQPETRLSALEIFTEQEKRELEKNKEVRKQSQRKKLMAVEPKAVKLKPSDS